jgi:hypothetical protein
MIVPSPAKGQPFEMQASALRVTGSGLAFGGLALPHRVAVLTTTPDIRP